MAAHTKGALAPDDSDPYEKTNRGIFEFNEELDKAVLEPVADSYDVIIPEPVQSGFTNIFNNAEYPINDCQSSASRKTFGIHKRFIQIHH